MDRLENLIEPSDDEHGPEYDFLRANNLTFRTWNCIKCPPNAVCKGTTDGKGWDDKENVGRPPYLPAPPYPEPEYWCLAQPQFRTAMFACNEGFCKGGDTANGADGRSVCNTANSGRLCAQCAESSFKSAAFNRCVMIFLGGAKEQCKQSLN